MAEGRPAQAGGTTGANPVRTGPAYSLKIVIFNKEDLDYAAALHKRYPEVPLILQTGNPEPVGGETGDTALRLLAAYENLLGLVMERKELRDVRVLPQLHALVWGNKRGV
ncbi:7-carboxy-7-deazaguanine synthase [compost metagenome]